MYIACATVDHGGGDGVDVVIYLVAVVVVVSVLFHSFVCAFIFSPK